MDHVTDQREPSLATWAETWRRCLHHRLADLDRLKAAADEWISRLDAPSAWLIDVVAMSRSVAEALSAIRTCRESFDRDQVLAGMMAAWRELLDADGSYADRIARALFFMSAYEGYAPSPEAAGDMLSFWDGLDLARSGIHGDLEVIQAELLAFLDHWSKPESYSGDWQGGGAGR